MLTFTALNTESIRPYQHWLTEAGQWIDMDADAVAYGLEHDRILLANETGQPVALLMEQRQENGAISLLLAVHPDQRGQGLGPRVLEAFAAQRPGERLEASIHRENVASQKCFSRSGFQAADETDMDGFTLFIRLTSIPMGHFK